MHGDLKGDNFMVGADGKAKVIDFGLSSIINKAEVMIDTKRMGAVHWKSPEYLAGERPPLASDVYSFAMCILEAVTGDIPWGRNVLFGIVKFRVRKGQIPRRPANMDDKQWNLIELMTAHDPSRRVKISFVADRLYEIYQEELALHSSTQTGATAGRFLRLHICCGLFFGAGAKPTRHTKEMEERATRLVGETHEWTLEELEQCIMFAERGPSPELTSENIVLPLHQRLLLSCDGWALATDEGSAAASSGDRVGEIQTKPADDMDGDRDTQTDNDPDEEVRLKLEKYRARKRDGMQRMRKRRRDLVVKMKETLQLLDRQYERLRHAVEQQAGEPDKSGVLAQGAGDIGSRRRAVMDLTALADDVHSLQEEKFWLEQLHTNQQKRLQRLKDAVAKGVPVLELRCLDAHPVAFAFSPITKDQASKFVRRCYENMRRLEQSASPLQPPRMGKVGHETDSPAVRMTEGDHEADSQDSQTMRTTDVDCETESEDSSACGYFLTTDRGIASRSNTFGWTISVEAASSSDTYMCFSKFFPNITPQNAMLRSWSQFDSSLQTLIARRLVQYKVLQVLDDSNYVVGIDMEHPAKPDLLLRGIDLRFRFQTNTGYVIGRTSLNPQSPEVRALATECSGLEYADSCSWIEFNSTASPDSSTQNGCMIKFQVFLFNGNSEKLCFRVINSLSATLMWENNVMNAEST